MDRHARTHAALRRAALELFAERGYDATTTAAIARRAGVSEMTLFRHYPTKEALLLQDPFDPLMAEAVRARPSGESPMAALTAGIRDAWTALDPADTAALREDLRPAMRIAATTPSLAGALDRSSTGTVGALVGALGDRGVARGPAAVAAGAVIAGLSRALLDWSLDDETDVETAILGALRVLGGEDG